MRASACVHTHVCVRMHACTHMQAHMYLCICVCVLVCVCVCVLLEVLKKTLSRVRFHCSPNSVHLLFSYLIRLIVLYCALGPKSTISIPILQYIIHYNILVPSSADSRSQSLTGINQLKLHIVVGTVLVLFPQPLVREGSLRVLVQSPHVAVVREVVQVVVQLLHILSMVSLPSTQPQQHSCQPLLGVNLSPEFVNLYFPYAGRGLLSFRW